MKYLRKHMSNNMTFVKIHISLWIKASIIDWVIITFTQKLSNCFFFVSLCIFIWYFLNAWNSMYNWNRVGMDFINNHISNVYFSMVSKHQYVTSPHSWFHRTRQYDHHWWFIITSNLNNSPYRQCWTHNNTKVKYLQYNLSYIKESI